MGDLPIIGNKEIQLTPGNLCVICFPKALPGLIVYGGSSLCLKCFKTIKDAMKSKDFEDFLQMKHADQFIGTKDVMVDDFSKWLDELDIDSFIKLGDEFGRSRKT